MAKWLPCLLLPAVAYGQNPPYTLLTKEEALSSPAVAEEFKRFVDSFKKDYEEAVRCYTGALVAQRVT